MVLTVGDLYCGAGGFSEGFRQAGFKVKWAIDNWPPAIKTFEKNFGIEVIDHDIMDADFSQFEHVDVVIGSPPCHHFSLARNGGNGNVHEGMKLVTKFFDAVLTLNPKYWIMENVPNIRRALIPCTDAGNTRLQQGDLKIPQMTVLNSKNYGVPQKRQRLFTGNFPIPAATHYDEASKTTCSLQRCKTMRDALGSLPHPLATLEDAKVVQDPLYGFYIPAHMLTEHSYITYLTEEEISVSRRSKESHSWAGKMGFPDSLDAPARTVTAYDRRSGRHTLVIEDAVPFSTHYRRPTLRELACLQSFPISYQFWGSTVSEKSCLIGNAVPPLLAFAMAKEILKAKGLELPERPIVNSQGFELAPSLPKEATTSIGKNRRMSLLRPFQDHMPGSITSHSSKTACRVDMDNKGTNPRIHPMMKFESANSCQQVVRHIVEWRAVLYTGYAKTVRASAINIDNAARLLLEAETQGLVKKEEVSSFVTALMRRLPEFVPDATTLQAARARRCNGELISPLDFAYFGL